jgi:hypothetical protein
MSQGAGWAAPAPYNGNSLPNVVTYKNEAYDGVFAIGG